LNGEGRGGRRTGARQAASSTPTATAPVTNIFCAVFRTLFASGGSSEYWPGLIGQIDTSSPSARGTSNRFPRRTTRYSGEPGTSVSLASFGSVEFELSMYVRSSDRW